MPLYDVSVERSLTETATVRVIAEGPGEALQRALYQAKLMPELLTWTLVVDALPSDARLVDDQQLEPVVLGPVR